MKLIPAIAALAALALAASAAEAQDRFRAASRPTCKDGAPRLIFIVNATSDTDCSTTGGGVTEAPCLCLDGTWTAMLGGGSGGGVTSVALAVPSEWTVSGSPITSSGTITISEATQAANTVYAGPTTGGAAAPGFRALVAADLPYQRLPSMDWPPATAPDWSCEFSGSLCSGTLSASGTTSTPVPGTIDILASVTGDPVYSLTFLPGSYCVQSDESTAQITELSWPITPGENETFLAKFTQGNRNLDDGEGVMTVSLFNSGDSNEGAGVWWRQSAAGRFPRLRVENNGSLSLSEGVAVTENANINSATWMALWKVGNVYWIGWASTHDAPMAIIGPQTKTGVTTFDTLTFQFLTANNTPSIVGCVDYVRRWSGLKFDFVSE